MTMKIALALFVKNENQNILSWLAWHIALVINKFFIHDDHSTDGTYEILKAVSNIYDIDVELSDTQNIPSFYWRQAQAFQSGCQKAADQDYDWIGFLDADEFVSLEIDQTLQDYFEKFSDYNGVSLNWKIYGSSYRALKTKIPTYEAYNWHCNKDLDDTSLTKCFIRPKTYNGYINPHHFNVTPDKYADANVNDISEKKEKTENVIWEAAWINHYINRSMEDFLERVRNRLNEDIPDSTFRWNHFERNEIYQSERQDFINKANEILLSIKKECVSHYLFNITKHIPQSTTPNDQNIIFSLQTIQHNKIGLEKEEGFLYHAANHQKLKKINGVRYKDNPSIIYLFQYNNNTISNVPFNIRGIEKFISTYQLILEPVKDTNYFSLKSPYSKKYLSFPQDGNEISLIQADRDEKKEWEFIKIVPETIKMNFINSPSSIQDLYSFYHYLYKNKETLSYEDFILAFNLLTFEEKREIQRQPDGKIISWL